MVDTLFSLKACPEEATTMSDIQPIPLATEHTAILRKCQSALCYAVEAKFHCKAILHNMEEVGSFGSNTSGVKRYSTKLSSRVEVSVWKDDLTCHNVDAVVNAANEKLQHGGGLAQALCDAGGPMIQKWSDDIIQQVQRVKTGDAVLTPAGNLPCKCIIHAVGPCLPPNPSQKDIDRAAPLLYNAIIKILQTAVYEKNISSVAIPALSSGLFHFPRNLCADIIVKAIQKFHEFNGFQGKNLEIHLVNNDEPTVQEMMRATRATLELSSITGANTASETPTVEFHCVSKEAQREAKAWTFKMLKLSNNMSIRNNHVIYLDQRDHENMLSLQAKFHVCIKKFFRSGNGGITITGSPSKSFSCAAIEVESMLCKAQEDFAQNEEHEILYSVVRWSCKDEPWIQTPEISAALEKAYLAGNEELTIRNHKVNVKNMILYNNSGRLSLMKRTCLLDRLEPLNNSFYARTHVSSDEYDDKEGRRTLKASGLCIIKVEKLENIVLKQLFNKHGQRMNDKPKHLYQRVSAQFCDLICRVGFRKEFAPPAEQRYGSGIYFSTTVDGALKLWKEDDHEQYIYIIQAQVLTGRSMIGSPDFILQDPLDRYDSMSDKGQTYVIFNGQQALPECLIICDKSTAV